MNKTIVTIIIVLLVAIGGGAAYFTLSEDESTATETTNQITQEAQESSETPQATTPPPSSAEQPAAGQYIQYSEAALAAADGTKILFFHADWCPQCRQLASSIQSNGLPAGVTVFEVDYDSNQALRQKYGVTTQTTLVKVDANGSLVDKYVAYSNPTVQAVTDNLL